MHPSMRSLLATILFGAVASAWQAPARANGRFPLASQLAVDPGDPKHIVARTTYGLLETFDAGAAWGWICESASLQDPNSLGDPTIGVLSDGSVIASLPQGLSVSHDRGCSWSFESTSLDHQDVIDLAVERTAPSHAVAVAATPVDGGFRAILAQTMDNGQTWGQAGVPLDPDLLVLTVEVAPSDSNRIYVSAVALGSHYGVLARSDTRGASWERLPIAGVTGSAQPYIGAVDPNDANKIYVRSDDAANDWLLFSSDGGRSWTPIYTAVGDMLGFALSPDGSKVAVGGPDDGIHVSRTDAYDFQKTSELNTVCLTWAPAGLYACSKWDFTIGLSVDEGKTFQALNHLIEFCPLKCSPGTPTAEQCPDQWQAAQQAINVDTYTCPGVPGSPGTGTERDGGSDVAPPDGAKDALPEDGGNDASPQADGKPSTGGVADRGQEDDRGVPREAGCACTAASGSSGAGAPAAVLLALAGARLRRRDRRRNHVRNAEN